MKHNLQFDFLAIHINGPYLEINAYSRDKTGRKLVFTESQEET